MDKRKFLSAVVLGAVTPVFANAPKTTSSIDGPSLLTVTGAIGHGNRGPLDPALDQLMKKQGLKFDKAHTFNFAALTSLPAVTINPTLEYDNKSHVLAGPLLVDVIKATGAVTNDKSRLLLRAIDGYGVTVTLGDVQKYRFIVATTIDGKAIPLGGLGPLWTVYDADRFSDMVAKPVNERFALCPWGLYHIEVQQG
ncbi:MAG: molybdopterin-dependent oxidoreductase [Burkholderiaceae bacterium]